MKILGIDYGRSKIGVALAENGFVEPLQVLHIKNFDDAVRKVLQVAQVSQVSQVIIGVSEGAMAEETVRFVNALRSSLFAIPCETFDETLTSRDAQQLSVEAGISRKKRREMEDAYAAAIMLQNYLDSKH